MAATGFGSSFFYLALTTVVAATNNNPNRVRLMASSVYAIFFFMLFLACFAYILHKILKEEMRKLPWKRMKMKIL